MAADVPVPDPDRVSDGDPVPVPVPVPDADGRLPVSGEVACLVTALTVTTSRDLCDGTVVGACLEGDVTTLARASHVLQAELARRVTAAGVHDALAHAPRTILRQQAWTRTGANRLVVAAGFAHAHPVLGDLWRFGRVGVEVVHAFACGTRPLTGEQAAGVVAVLAPVVVGLDVDQVRKVIADAVDLLRPTDPDAREQDEHDARFLTFARLGDTVLLKGRLAGVDAAAVQAAIHALAETARAEGDGLTLGQRYADALANLVARAAAGNHLPVAAGVPAATTITISLTEADRVAAGHPRPRPADAGVDLAHVDLTGLLELAQRNGSHPGAIGTSITLGDAAARFALCATPLTGILVHQPTSGGTYGNGSGSGGGSSGGSPIGTVLATARLEPLAVGRAQRLATTAQRKALTLRDKECVIPGCSVPGNECQSHHVVDWTAGGATDLDNLALCCWAHHRQVDLHRWSLTRNPDPNGPHWITRRTHRSAWRPRQYR